MRQDVLDIPDHLRDALWRFETAQLQTGQSSALLIGGVGGSAIGGDLARAVIGDRLQRPMLTVRGYTLPSWATAEVAVLSSSFSGSTEEAVACFDAAGELGARRIVASTGGSLTEAARAAGVPIIGLPGILSAPRAAVAYMVVIALEVAAHCGVGPRLVAEIEAAAAELETMRDEIAAEAVAIAGAVGSSLPVIYGAELTAPVAWRWKAQVNENAKRPAFASVVPEANHNEICAWGIEDLPASGTGVSQAAILLSDEEHHPRIRRRLELTGELIESAGNAVYRAPSRGTTRLARLMSAVMLGDLLSLELAAQDGTDPLPIPAIERLKAGLA